ncbi:DNA polymerase phi-domain-containing protein [Irpex rosettiformis]|uniref:DNA polymerase phi-domain-containing protein n=1 Tax=Irpex rosettiformis TaxID=378272 RepID=A0ACB8TXD2_9APHY|nr:DNA polymerase phi-domain-containing protein [Irpex rosettiformis]
MSTTLPLFWHLSSARKQERIDASVKLVGALEHFQAQFVPPPPKDGSDATSEDEEEGGEGGDEQDEDDDVEEEEEEKGDGLDVYNAQDVSYSIRRLVRGLASPRESSRLGFAVALTELLSRITTVTCSQIITLILDSSKPQGSMTGQEERDVLFARLFGLTAVIRSGLLVRTTPLSTSGSTAPAVSTLSSYQTLLENLIALGEKKSWLKESAWWAIGLASDALKASSVDWKDDAFEATVKTIYTGENAKAWSPEKVALTVKLQEAWPEHAWKETLAPTFKHAPLVHTGNYAALARIMKDLSVDSDEEEDERAPAKGKQHQGGSWKPQVHFVWNLLLDEVLSSENAYASFPEFFRILVDESLFSAASSPERKFWGFQIFQKALPRVGEADVPMLFTKNFMRSWINHLSNSDRYLHKAAKQVANDIQVAVKKNPTLGFTFILQLTGVHGSQQFDRLTKTKTVETILTSMTQDGIQSYIEYLLKQVNDEHPHTSDVQALNARRAWIVDQLAALVRNGAIPKDDRWVQTILDWFVVHGLFSIKKNDKSSSLALHNAPSPVFSDELRKLCRERLLSSLAELTTHTSLVKIDDKTSKVAAVASDGEFWVSKVLASIEKLEKDTKHVSLLAEIDDDDEDEVVLRSRARELIGRLKHITDERREAARGTGLLLAATLLNRYCAADEEESDDNDALESCIDGASRMFPEEESTASKKKKDKKQNKLVATAAASRSGPDLTDAEDDVPEPVDILVDTVIGFLEEATAYMRAVANQVFSLLSESVRESTIDLILAQLERRAPDELLEEGEDHEMAGEGEGNTEGEDEEENEEDGDEDEEEEEEVVEDDEEIDVEEDPELRRKIEEALRVNGIQAATGESDDESDEELMDDDQMMAIDEQLAAVFRAQANEKRLGKGVDAQREATHYKNRVLDLLDTFIKKQPTSPLIPRLILPLVDLIVNAGTDEKQLSDKATGILRSRIGKSKDTASSVDGEQVSGILREIHSRARKASTGDIVTTLAQCSVYLSRALLHAQVQQPVLDAYRESLVDFVTRKASRLNTAFFHEFIRKHANVSWELRDTLLELSGKAVNGYRQSQVFQLIQVLLSQASATTGRTEEVLPFMSDLSQSVQKAVQEACEAETLSAGHVKQVLKLALSAARQSKKFAQPPKELHDAWQPSSWETLGATLAASDRFKSSTGLPVLCKQIAHLTGQDGESSGKAKGAKKRKADAVEGTEDVESPKKAKRKVKKTSA